VSNARIAATAGWLTLAAILASEVILPSLLIGSPPTGSMDRVAVEAYYAHESLLPLGLVAIATIIGFVVFATALREVLLALGDRAFWANAGFAFALVAAALLLVRTALQMALVRGLASGSDIMPTFFAWDFTYNTALYAMEASYPVAFAMARKSIICRAVRGSTPMARTGERPFTSSTAISSTRRVSSSASV